MPGLFLLFCAATKVVTSGGGVFGLSFWAWSTASGMLFGSFATAAAPSASIEPLVCILLAATIAIAFAALKSGTGGVAGGSADSRNRTHSLKVLIVPILVSSISVFFFDGMRRFANNFRIGPAS